MTGETLKAPRTKERTGAAWKAVEDKAADCKQYDRYNGLLDEENMPETFEKFGQMKYTDAKVWIGKRGSNATSVGRLERKRSGKRG